MTQEWFESADVEKTSSNEKKDNPSNPVIPQEELKEKEELPVVEENLQSNPEEQEADLEKVENDEHEELVENTDKSEEAVKEDSQTSKPLTDKSLESPFVPDPLPTKTAILKEEFTDFWIWLRGALKEPTASFNTDKKHSYNAFSLLTLFTAISFFFSIYHIKQAYYGQMAAANTKVFDQLPSLSLFSALSILVAASLFFFSILMGGFVVKRFIDQNNEWTLDKTFQEYSRLFAIPILLTSMASFFAFFNSLKFTILLCLISLGMVLLANLYIISRPSKDSQTDPFYRLLLAFLVNGSILFLFFFAEMALVFDYLRILAFM